MFLNFLTDRSVQTEDAEEQISWVFVFDDNLGIIFLCEAILMSTYNMCFYG